MRKPIADYRNIAVPKETWVRVAHIALDSGRKVTEITETLLQLFCTANADYQPGKPLNMHDLRVKMRVEKVKS